MVGSSVGRGRRPACPRRAPLHPLALVLVSSAVALSGPVPGGAPPIFLGIVEPNPQPEAPGVAKPAFSVRVAFAYQNGTWKALPDSAETMEELAARVKDFPKDVRFTIAVDGRNGGELLAHRPDRWNLYAEIGLHRVDPAASIPAIPAHAGEFTYWEGSLPFRPFAAVSAPNTEDPDHWKPAVPAASTAAKLLPAFREAVGPTVPSCDGVQAAYDDARIRPLPSYASAKGAELVDLALDDLPVEDCDGPLGEAFDPRLFLVSGDAMRLIGRSLELIDAGDFDGDGHSEILFHESGYNHDGYVLLFDQLRQQVEFGWSYH